MCLTTFCTQAATIDLLKLSTEAGSWLNFGKPRLSQKCTEEITMEEAKKKHYGEKKYWWNKSERKVQNDKYVKRWKRS